MEGKDAVTGAAIAVLLAILGVVLTVGIILLMMWKQPGIERSPSEQGCLSTPGAASGWKLEILKRSHRIGSVHTEFLG